MDIARPIIQEALDTSHQFREGVSRRHGLLQPPRNVIGQTPIAPATPTPLSPSAVLPVAEALPVAKSWLPWIATAGLALGGGGVGASIAGLVLAAMNRAPVPSVATDEPPAPADEGFDLLLADLQERGYHLPPRSTEGSKP